MRTLGLALITAGLLLGAVPASAQDEGQTSFNLVGHQEGSDFYFTLEGQTNKNPTLVVPAGAEITVTLSSATGTHNFHPEGMPASEYVNEGDEPITYTFTAPESGSIEYWCDPHKSSGMVGAIQVAGEAGNGGDGGNGGEQNESPGVQVLGIALAGLGAALLLQRRRA